MSSYGMYFCTGVLWGHRGRKTMTDLGSVCVIIDGLGPSINFKRNNEIETG